MVCGLWFVVYGLWFMFYGLWLMDYGLWFMVDSLWFMVHGLWFRVHRVPPLVAALEAWVARAQVLHAPRNHLLLVYLSTY